MTYLPFARRRISKVPLVLTTALLAMLLLNACGSDPQTQQQAGQYKIVLENALIHAQSIGVPGSMLQPIKSQEGQLNNTSAPFGVFNDQPVNEYYANLAQRYQVLAVQVRGLESQATQQLDYQASLDLANFESALAERQAQ